MRTDDLVHAMVADHTAAQSSFGRQFALAISIGFAVSTVLFWVTLGLRPDIAAAALTATLQFENRGNSVARRDSRCACFPAGSTGRAAQVCRRSCWRQLPLC